MEAVTQRSFSEALNQNSDVNFLLHICLGNCHFWHTQYAISEKLQLWTLIMVQGKPAWAAHGSRWHDHVTLHHMARSCAVWKSHAQATGKVKMCPNRVEAEPGTAHCPVSINLAATLLFSKHRQSSGEWRGQAKSRQIALHALAAVDPYTGKISLKKNHLRDFSTKYDHKCWQWKHAVFPTTMVGNRIVGSTTTQ